eukprot:scaffold15311_cov136-Cylindrotheca_fusiformis.AAC.7
MNSPKSAKPKTSSNSSSIVDGEIRHSVSRSKELLSCAKTAWKIQQNEHQQDPTLPPLVAPNFELALSSNSSSPPPPSLVILEEGLTLLRSMDYGSRQLQKLVRRRGHTNDPTTEISKLVSQLEQDTEELTEFCQQLLAKYKRRRKQERRHWELVVQWFQQVAAKYSKQLQECLKLRGEVLAEQAQQRRKLVDTSTSTSNKNNSNNNTSMNNKKKNGHSNNRRANGTPLFDSPLFQTEKTSSKKWQPPPPSKSKPQIANGNGSTSQHPSPLPQGGSAAATATTSYYGGGGGYGGASNSGIPSYGGGMRQRKAAVNYNDNYNNGNYNNDTSTDYQQEEEHKVHYQIQQRQQQRQTQQRLDEAQQAETMLGELGQLFGKMSSLIVQQGETLEKLEDDVEAAHADVVAGQEELTKLYHLKKGNRPLIIKTFLILNFLIIFMRGYKN